MAELLALQQKMTGWVAQLERITPVSGFYLNEVNPQIPFSHIHHPVNDLICALIVGITC